MRIHLVLALALAITVSACGRIVDAVNESQQTQVDPRLEGLDVLEGGYVRLEPARWTCRYCDNFPGRWFSENGGEIPVYASPRINAEVIGHLEESEWVLAVSHEKHSRPRRAVVTRAGEGLEVGEALVVLWAEYDDGGGALMEVWHRGRSIIVDGGEGEPEVGSLEGERDGIDWFYIEREGGRPNGWLRDPRMWGVENRIDECPAADNSPPCRSLRSRAAPTSVSYSRPEPFRDCADCPSMVWIPGQSFAISQYEVTIAQWNACIAANYCPSGGMPIPGPGNRPIANFSAQSSPNDYLEWLSQRTGHRYRLPTEEEWSAAAFPGGRAQIYYWGNQAPVCERGARNGVAFAACGSQEPLAVGSFQPNAFGLYDVLGNVAEMTLGNGGIEFLGGSWRSTEAQLGGPDLGRQDSTDLENLIAGQGFRVVREQ